MSEDSAISQTLASLRLTRAHHEAIHRRLRILIPALLVVFVVAAYQARPRPSVDGRGLVVSLAVVCYILGTVAAVIFLRLGEPNALKTITRPGGARRTVAVAVVVFASSVALMWAQAKGPGAGGALLGVILFARLLPWRIALTLSVAAFVVIEVFAGLTGQGLPGLTVLGVIAACYGLMLLAVRLRQANDDAAALLIALEHSRGAETHAAGLAERQRLAREMHDVLAHSLSGLLLQLEGARMLAAENPADPRIPEAIERAHHLGRTGLDEARRAIGMLRDDELPGPQLLEELAVQFQDDRGIPCQLAVSGEVRVLGSQARLALYRVAQEALTNIAKHARPDRVELRLAYESCATRLTVEDIAHAPTSNELPTTSKGAGYGLTGMRERAELLGGTLVTEQTPSGYRVELAVPT